ncbi:hypothetical protein BKI52_28085 [marine bacterium AO1-C]|nr:hypothetical protein BKI52_28085 [marine bacterium AO1-C]
MERIYESKFQSYTLDQDKSYLQAHWSDESEMMVDQDFKDEMEAELKYVEAYKVTKYLIDTLKFGFVINPALQAWTDKHINKKLDELGLQKLAYIVSQDFISQLSIKQTMNESEKQNYETRFFTSLEEAEAWLFA